VPEGVEVDVSGSVIFGTRDLKLAPVPRLAGTPLVRVDVSVYFGSVIVKSKGPQSGSPLEQWVRDKFNF
jgi:hypothetical protein